MRWWIWALIVLAVIGVVILLKELPALRRYQKIKSM